MAEVFIGREALASGRLTRGQLRWNYRTILPGVYLAKAVTPSLRDRTVGAWLWSGRQAVVAGQAAAALHGDDWVGQAADVELIWRCGRPPPGVVVRNERIEADEITEINGLPVTTPERTAFDLARHLDRDPAVIHLDALARTTGVAESDVHPLTDRYRGARGLWRAATALRLMDCGSQSPRETIVRLALVDSGLPAPDTELRVPLEGSEAVVAMGYPEPLVGVEFGTGSTDDLSRTGWKLIPGGADRPPKGIACVVRMAVSARGYPRWRLRRYYR